jgi:hypothetical protein
MMVDPSRNSMYPVGVAAVLPAGLLTVAVSPTTLPETNVVGVAVSETLSGSPVTARGTVAELEANLLSPE